MVTWCSPQGRTDHHDGVRLTTILHCCLLITTLVTAKNTDRRVIFWGWWKPTTNRYPLYTMTTTPRPPPTTTPPLHSPSPSPQPPQQEISEADELSNEIFPQEPSTTSQWEEETTTDSPLSMEEEPPNVSVYWNVPTFQCHKYGLNFTDVSKKWGLLQNSGDEFRGEWISILYDPGEFPALLKAGAGSAVTRNGGVPQEASLGRHLKYFKEHVEKQIPDPEFSGLGVIDFEHWRPVWRQNWGSLAVYRDYSRYVERHRHPYWFSSIIEAEASFKYELAARTFMVETLREAKRLRPLASWGYYGYPFCFNYTPNNNRASCSWEVVRDNDEMSWLFEETTSHFPSLYLKEDDMYHWKRRRFVEGRLEESLRIAKEVPVYPYVWYKYHDSRSFLSYDDMRLVLETPVRRGCRGVVIWGASRDVNSRERCVALAEYLDNVIGPIVQELSQGVFRMEELAEEEQEEEEEEDEEGKEEFVVIENVLV